MTRSILRWVHVALGVPIVGYVYSPFEAVPHYAPAVRFIFLPALVLSGLWVWKGRPGRRPSSDGRPGAGRRPVASPPQGG